MKQTFTDYNFNDAINTTLGQIGFVRPTPIQAKVIPQLRKGMNTVGISKTGSGKTHGFLLPIIEGIDLSNNHVQALIILPTRELAMQIHENVKAFMKNMPELRTTLLVGGSSVSEEGINSHILIGTPGRLTDVINQQKLVNTKYLKYVVIDEADMVFDKKFIEETDVLLADISDQVVFSIFSATITDNMHPFYKKYFDGVKIIEIDEGENENIQHIIVNSKGDKFKTLETLMADIQPYLCLIFASKKETVEEIFRKLQDDGHKIIMLHGDLPSRERAKTLKRINDLEFTYVVASDIAARGIDIDGVSHVISYDLPKELEYYIHRAGRTGRFDYTGYSYILYDPSEDSDIKKLERKGITFAYYDFYQGHLQPAGVRSRDDKKMAFDNVETAMVNKVKGRKKVKVKPGYKKKQKLALEKLRKKAKQDEIKTRIRKQRKVRKQTSDFNND